MCGFAGFLNQNSKQSFDIEEILNKMGNVISHRGPDGSGIWYEEAVGSVGLVHRRLSILDLSKAGHQPMVSSSGRYVLVYNGEIYNHLFLRELIGEGIEWTGSSDTETLLVCIQELGLELTLEKVDGMFSFALWDRNCNTITLARDRMGEKPLYYGFQKDTLLFGSDLISLKQHPDFLNEISRNSVALLLKYGYVPAPYSIYGNIFKLPPGGLIQIDTLSKKVEVQYYWNFKEVVEEQQKNTYSRGYGQAVKDLDVILLDSVEQQMISDVPLGCFLSGGIDSSAIVALAQSQSSSQINTFSIGYSDQQFNEAENAKAVSHYLGTKHTELYITENDALDIIPELSKIYTEPFADPSQIPMFMLAQMTRNHVTVALSGDGGDELFSGYSRHLFIHQYWPTISKLPKFLREFVKNSIATLPPNRWNDVFSSVKGFIPKRYHQRNIGEKLYKISQTMESNSSNGLYNSLVSKWTNPEEVVLGVDWGSMSQCSIEDVNFGNEVEKIMAQDSTHYLPDDVLCKVDRATMFASLESRSPFLGRNVVEFAWSLPHSYKIRNGVGKSILRDVLYNYVPKELIDRPKMGFDTPIGCWLRGALKPWANDLLNDELIERQGYFDISVVRKIWSQHQSGLYNMENKLWPILIFQSWLLANEL